MKLFGLQFGTPTEDDLARLRAAEPTYDHVGSTLGAEPDAGPQRHESSVKVGVGESAFLSARGALRSWLPQRSLGASIAPTDVVPGLDETVILSVGVGPLRLLVPNRIVSMVDEPDRYGYAYGSLPGHPERGEEFFLVEMLDGGDVVLTIRVDAEPAHQLRWLRPVIVPLGRVAVGRYQSAVVRALRS